MSREEGDRASPLEQESSIDIMKQRALQDHPPKLFPPSPEALRGALGVAWSKWAAGHIPDAFTNMSTQVQVLLFFIYFTCA